jgi:hypothetical protein
MTHTFSKSAFYSFGDIPLAGPLPLIFSQLLRLGVVEWVKFLTILGKKVIRPQPPAKEGVVGDLTP